MLKSKNEHSRLSQSIVALAKEKEDLKGESEKKFILLLKKLKLINYNFLKECSNCQIWVNKYNKKMLSIKTKFKICIHKLKKCNKKNQKCKK